MHLDQLTLAFGANVALGGFLLVLALLIGTRSPDRAARGPFAVYLTLVGANYILDALGQINHGLGGPADEFRYASLVATLLDPPVLLLFALAATGRELTRRRVALVAAPALLLLTLFVLSPPYPPFMPWWPFRGAYLALLASHYALAFALILSAYLSETRSLQRDRLAILVTALGVVVLPRIPLLALDFGLAKPGYTPMVVGTLIGGLVGLYLLVVASACRLARPALRSHACRTLLSLGGLLGAVCGLWALLLVAPLSTAAVSTLYSGRWFLFAAVLSSGIRRYDLLGLPDRAEPWIRRALAAAVVALITAEAAAVLYAFQGITRAAAVGTSVALVGTAAALHGALVNAVPRTPSELGWRRHAVYRAHVELGADPEALSRLQRELNIPDAEAREIRLLVEAERAVPVAARPRGPEPGEVFLDRYEVRAVLGVGTFGTTFRAWDRVEGQPVVLKELHAAWRKDREVLERFRREAEAALRVSHPNVVGFRSLERVGEGYVLVLAHVEGETLRERLQRGPLGVGEASALARGLLAGLEALHRAGIVHRDVKPENVVLRPGGEPVLLDFGAATLRNSTGTARAGSGGHPGTPGYMSPEQQAGETVRPESDLYSLGVVLWESLAGAKPPFGVVPEDWRRPLLRALEALPRDRWSDAAAFRAALPPAAAPAVRE